jgi:hypothetical protein
MHFLMGICEHTLVGAVRIESAMCRGAAGRVSIGDNSILGDHRWGGLFGIEAQFIAVDDVKVGLGDFSFGVSVLYMWLCPCGPLVHSRRALRRVERP